MLITNAVLLNFLFIKKSTTILHFNFYKKYEIFLEQQIRMIYEASCDSSGF